MRLLMGIHILRAGTEAIVNAADGSLSGGGVVNAAIRAAAGPDLDEELRRIGTCPAGGAVITGAGRIPAPARFIIHVVGPNYSLLGDEECAALLRRAHTESLRLAEENGVKSVVFPVISAECNGYPIHKAADIAFSAAVDHLVAHAGSVDLIVFALSSVAELMAFTAALGASASALSSRASSDRRGTWTTAPPAKP